MVQMSFQGKKHPKYRVLYRDIRYSHTFARYFNSKKEAQRYYNMLFKRKYQGPISIMSYDAWSLNHDFRDVW